MHVLTSDDPAIVLYLLNLIMLKQQLQQKLQQKLSPQQIQLIRLLELPAIELEERVKHELEDNPALEEGKDIAEDFDRTDEGGEELTSNETEGGGETDIDLSGRHTRLQASRIERADGKEGGCSFLGQ